MKKAISLLMALVVVSLAPAGAQAAATNPDSIDASAEAAATVIGKGEFVGFVDVSCDGAQSVTCDVSIRSILCAEAIVDSGVSVSCRVSITASIDGLGTKDACVLFGNGSGTVSSISGSYSHSGILTHGGAGGAYEGTGDAGATGVFVEASWAAPGCTDVVDGVVKGGYEVTLSP